MDDLLRAVAEAKAAALALSMVTVPAAEATHTVGARRTRLRGSVCLWLGGSGARGLELPASVEYFESLEHLEPRVALLRIERTEAM